MSDPIWHYVFNDQKQGPVSVETLRELVKTGVIDGRTLIWSEGMEDWEPASRHLNIGFKPKTRIGPSNVPDLVARDGSVGFWRAVSLYWSRYFDFSGRSGRAEYWWAFLFVLIVNVIIAAVEGGGPYDYGSGPMAGLFALVTLVPSLSLAVRRLHDTDRSGWWLLICLVPLIGVILLLVWFVTKGDEGQNRFG